MPTGRHDRAGVVGCGRVADMCASARSLTKVLAQTRCDQIAADIALLDR